MRGYQCPKFGTETTRRPRGLITRFISSSSRSGLAQVLEHVGSDDHVEAGPRPRPGCRPRGRLARTRRPAPGPRVRLHGPRRSPGGPVARTCSASRPLEQPRSRTLLGGRSASRSRICPCELVSLSFRAYSASTVTVVAAGEAHLAEPVFHDVLRHVLGVLQTVDVADLVAVISRDRHLGDPLPAGRSAG